MAYDSVRKQLDQLMGLDRNGPVNGPGAEKLKYTDGRVCKSFLLGLCPRDLPIKHRSEPGSCGLVHAPELKADFNSDDARGAVRDKGLWMRELLAACKSIVAEEDRKIRGHARRLQDSYGAESFAGLMIRNFDTLRALGMVAKDAVIGESGNVSDEEDAFSDREDGAGGGVKAEIAKGKRSSIDDSASGVGAGPVSEKGDGVDGDDAGLDGFGVIKVTPANAIPEKPPGSPISTPACDRSGSKEDGTAASVDDKSKENGTLNDAIEPSAGNLDASKVDEEPKLKGENASAAESATVDAVDADLAARRQRMEDFYTKGTGPDGLLMLEKKNSLRVCAGCGGFISLVDAESRLLSHFRGKAHHSMSLLREKIEELEPLVAADASAQRYADRGHNSRYRPYSRDGYSERAPNAQQWGGQHAWQTREPPRDRYVPNHDNRDNHVYRNSRSRSPFGRDRDIGRDHEYGARYEHPNDRDWRSRRSDNDRYKRRRSPSPQRDRRRSRYY